MTEQCLDDIITSRDAISAESPLPISFSIHPSAIKKPITLHLWHPRTISDSLHLVIVTHGAGGTALSAACHNLCSGLSCAGDPSSLAVLAFDGSMNLKARTKAFVEVIKYAATSEKVTSISLAGRSMGCRAAAIAYAESDCEKLSHKIVLESYPLIGTGEDVRLQVLKDLPEEVRFLFIQGTADEMCPRASLDAAISKDIRAGCTTLDIEGADHGMGIPATIAGRGKKDDVTEQIGRRVGQIAGEWLLASETLGQQHGHLDWADEEINWSGWTSYKSQPDTAVQAREHTVDEHTSEPEEPAKPARKRRRKG